MRYNKKKKRKKAKRHKLNVELRRVSVHFHGTASIISPKIKAWSSIGFQSTKTIWWPCYANFVALTQRLHAFGAYITMVTSNAINKKFLTADSGYKRTMGPRTHIQRNSTPLFRQRRDSLAVKAQCINTTGYFYRRKFRLASKGLRGSSPVIAARFAFFFFSIVWRFYRV